jgi:hypothetical protein
MPVCLSRSGTDDYRKKSYAGQNKSPAFRHLLIAAKVSWYFSSSLFDQLEELPWDAEQMIVDYFSFCYVFPHGKHLTAIMLYFFYFYNANNSNLYIFL